MKTIVRQIETPKEDYKEIIKDGDKTIAEITTQYLGDDYVQCSGWFLLPTEEK